MSLFAVTAFIIMKPFKVFAEAGAILKLLDNKEKTAAATATPATPEKKSKKPKEEPLSPTGEKLKIRG